MYFKGQIFIVFSFIVTHLSGFAQESCSLKFSGKIVNETGEPLVGAFVMISPDSVTRAADQNGNFKFEKLCAANYTVTVEFLGYKAKTIHVTIDKDIDRTIQMEPVTTQLQEVVVEDKLLNVEHAQNFSVLSEKQLSETAGKSL